MRKIEVVLGTGIGIVAATLVIYIATLLQPPKISDTVATKEMTDYEIMQRASDLGMIFFDDSYVFVDGNMSEEEVKNIAESVEKTPVVAEEYVEIQVKSGYNSLDVANMLKEKGLVNDAEEFNRYLIINDADRYIRTGTHLLRKGSTEQELLNALTGR